MMIMRRCNGSIAISFSWAFVLRHFWPSRAHKAFVFPQKAMYFSYSFHASALASIQVHVTLAAAMALVLIVSRSFILIFVRYVFWLESRASTIPPTTT